MHVVVAGSRDRRHPVSTSELLPPSLLTEASALPAAGAFAAFTDEADLVRTLQLVLRCEHLVLGVLLDRAPNQRAFAATRCLELARSDRYGIAVDARAHDPRGAALSSALMLTASVMRRRTPAMWEALDTLDELGTTSANRAAAMLGCSGQAVRERRQRAHATATADLTALLSYLLAGVP